MMGGEQSEVTLRGLGLFTGAPSRITLRRMAGPVRLCAAGESITLRAAQLLPGTLSTTVALAHTSVRTVEHLAAAFAGLGIEEGVEIEVEGPEIPLMDGRASAFADALLSLNVPASPPRARILRAERIEIGGSIYRFTPGPEVHVAVEFLTDDPRLLSHAEWAGGAQDFMARIAGARTFALEKDLLHYAAAGVQVTLEPSQVVIVGSTIHATGQPFSADEPARHKLLDLLGDLYLTSGLMRGSLIASRPGHATTREVMAIALREGIVARQLT